MNWVSLVELFDRDFAHAMSINYFEGIKGDRTANGWKTMEWNDDVRDRYIAKILRHTAQYAATSDPRHLAAVACNANILWHHEKENK